MWLYNTLDSLGDNPQEIVKNLKKRDSKLGNSIAVSSDIYLR